MNDLETSEIIKDARLEDFESLHHSISVKGGLRTRNAGANGMREGKKMTYVSFFWISSHFLLRDPGSKSSDGRAAVHADIGARGVDGGPGKLIPC